MITVTPDYYKDFKCIAGECTDTCCAGWDVDVDEDSYRFYKSVKGDFGKRLKKVMVPSKDGGCTFTLKDGRCPFLNDKNLCDLYIELGEDKLCDTCDEFPRFINEYGNIREIGIAPSCKTAGELMFSYRDNLTFNEVESDEQISSYNDIDPLTYMQLKTARNIAYEIVSDRGYSIRERIVLLLSFCKDIQLYLDKERDDLIVNVSRRYAGCEYRDDKIKKLKTKYYNPEKCFNIPKFFDTFKGMEVINPDWEIYCREVKDFFGGMKSCEELNEIFKEFNSFMEDKEFEYEQLLMYYIYRYFLDAVYDYNLLLKGKNAAVGYIALKIMEIADRHLNNGKLTFERRVDLAHLYSRQFEHSYYNFEVYREFFCSKKIYAYSNLISILLSI